MAQSKGLPFVVTLNEKEGLPQSTDQKKEIEGEISKVLVYVMPLKLSYLKTYGQGGQLASQLASGVNLFQLIYIISVSKKN